MNKKIKTNLKNKKIKENKNKINKNKDTKKIIIKLKIVPFGTTNEVF